MAKIASNFDTAPWLEAIPSAHSADPDVVGAFRFLCAPSHVAYDDPIVYPSQPGRSHLHTFFGNTEANAFSTYESLRTTGKSTCRNALNRSAYWIPSLMNGRGQVVMPDYISIYYKRYPTSHPSCQTGEGCIGLPRGLRYVFGRTMNGPSGADHVYFDCQGASATPGHYPNLVEAARNCPSGSQIGAVVDAPSCWDGKSLDSADHRSHMAYSVYDAGLDAHVCPATHPFHIPTFTLAAWYTTDNTLDRSGNTSPTANTWYFASDRMEGMAPMTSGMTFHADWFGAWDDDILDTWIANCINKKLSCASGNLGGGTLLKASDIAEYKGPRLIDKPS